jgi:hypothetical protein
MSKFKQLLQIQIICALHQLCGLMYIGYAVMLLLPVLALVPHCSTGSCSCSCSMQLPYLAGSAAAAAAAAGSSTVSAGLQEGMTMFSQVRRQHQKQ